MAKRAVFIAVCLGITHGFLCSQIDIGSDNGKLGDIVASGVVNPDWTYQKAMHVSNPPDSVIYFYFKGLELIGPDYRVIEFHHEDESRPDSMKWVYMNVSVDEKLTGLFTEYTVFKVNQECLDREGGTVLHMNVTFGASDCDPITLN